MSASKAVKPGESIEQENAQHFVAGHSYTLVGFISHIGKNTGSGHYVAHVKKDGRWVIFDDQKVAASDSPPLDLGYVYMYRRLW